MSLLKKGKDTSGIIPYGNLEKENEKAAEEFAAAAESFFKNPLIPWWTKVSMATCPNLKKPTRTKRWCTTCGRKHDPRDECPVELVKDLTTEPKVTDPPRHTHKVGHYRVRSANG